MLFYGSSTIRLWPALAQDFPGIPVSNRGFGGAQIADAIRYAPRIVLPLQPETVVFYAGDNDLAAGKTPEQVFADFRQLVADFHNALPALRILNISIKPSPCRAHLLADIRAANALIREWSRTDSRLDYVEVFSLMLDADGAPRAELFAADNLHLNATGYALWRSILAAHL